MSVLVSSVLALRQGMTKTVQYSGLTIVAANNQKANRHQKSVIINCITTTVNSVYF